MLTLDRYITGLANRSIIAVMAILLSLMSLFTLLEELDESQVTYGFAEALRYILQTLPRRFDQVLVYGVFIGYLLSLGRLAESSELTVCRVSGMSPLRLCAALAPSMLMWLVLGMAVSEYIAPVSERQAETDKLYAQYGDDAMQQHGGLWLRDDNVFMQIQSIDENGDIWQVRQYRLGDDGRLATIVDADSGHYDASTATWEFTAVEITQLGSDGVSQEHLASTRWSNDMTPQLLAAQAFLEPSKMSLSDLYRQIQFNRGQRLSVAEYELAFWGRVMTPLTFMGLTLFALAVVLGPLREVGMGLRLTVGIFAGLGFKYLQDLFAPAAMVFDIPAVLAILMPIAIYWAIAWQLIRRNA